MQIERRLDDWIDGFMACTANSEPPTQFRIWTAISVVAAALQRKCFIEWDTEIFPNMYICLVGPPGSKKGTAMGPGAKLLKAVGIEVAAEAITIEQLIAKMSEITNTDHDPVTGEMILHSSFTVFSEEFTVFLGYNEEAKIARLCRLYDCPNPFNYETKTQGKYEVIGAWLNIIGATTPDSLAASLPSNAIRGGLTSRMIMVYGNKRAKRVSIPIRTQEERRLFEVLKFDLEKINLMKGRFRFTEEFMRAYTAWYESGENHPPLSEHYDAYLSRRSTHLRKLCMILSASRSNSMIIEHRDFVRALEILGEAEKHMNEVFAGVGKAPIAELFPRVIKFITECGVTSYRDLMRKFYQDADRQTMDRVLETLIKMEYIQLEQPMGKIIFKGPLQDHEILKAQL